MIEKKNTMKFNKQKKNVLKQPRIKNNPPSPGRGGWWLGQVGSLNENLMIEYIRCDKAKYFHCAE